MLVKKRPADEHALSHHGLTKSNISPASRSQSTSARNSPVPPELPASDASIVLIGIRGTGKSSLAVIASCALGYRVIHTDEHFLKSTGLSRAAYNAKYGVEEYKQRELRIMRSVLQENQSRCVITCGPGSVEGQGRELLGEYAKTHPVIHILRDLDEVQRHLRAWDAKTISDLIDLTTPAYRASSSFEFYNISESRSAEGQEPMPVHPTLTLKNLQSDFLRLVYHVTRRAPLHSRHGSGYEAGHVVSSLAPESKPFTYALTIHLSTLPQVLSELSHLQSTADAVRFVVDSPSLPTENLAGFTSTLASSMSRDFYLVRRYAQIPMIFEVERPRARGAQSARTREELEREYFQILHFGLRFSPEYICVDMNYSIGKIRKVLAAKGSTKVIGCYFDNNPGDDGWATQARARKVREAEELGFDIVWVSQEATSSLDNSSAHRLAFKHGASSADRPRPPLIAYNIGRLGRVSCWQNSTLTPVTHSRLRPFRPNPATDSLLTILEAQNALYSSYTLDSMFFGVLGSKVATSVSPGSHNAGYQFCGMPHEYRVFQRSSLTEMREVFRDHFFGGASISSPFKREIIAIVDFMSPEAEAIGAVNTLVPLRGNSKSLLERLLDRNRAGPITGFYGECTDWIAIHNCVSRSLSPINTVHPSTTAVVLGAGGMARAAIYAMIRLGVRNIFVCNRTVKKAQEVADHFSRWQSSDISSARAGSSRASTPRADGGHTGQRVKVGVISSLNDSWPADTEFPTIVVSTLPGFDSSDSIPIDNRVPQGWLASPNGGVIAELAYDPLETPLLRQAATQRSRGWISVDGLQHSLEQGAPQFELFTGRRAPRQHMGAALRRSYKELRE